MKTVGVVGIAYIVCWLPHFIVIVIMYWCEHIFVHFSNYSPTTYDIVMTIINNILPTLNSCINPIIYGILSEQFRIEFSDLVRRCFGLPRYWSTQYSTHESYPMSVMRKKISLTSPHMERRVTECDSSPERIAILRRLNSL